MCHDNFFSWSTFSCGVSHGDIIYNIVTLDKGLKMTDIKLNDYIDLIRKEAWHYAKKYCLDFDEVLSACYEVYCKALRTNITTALSPISFFL